MSKTPYKYDPNSREVLVVAQIGDLRVIGVRIHHEIVPGQTKNVSLYHVGALVTQRGLLPGKLAGTTVMAKSVTIVPLDFTSGPIGRMTVALDNSYVVDESTLSKTDIETYVSHYNKFLSGENNEIAPNQR